LIRNNVTKVVSESIYYSQAGGAFIITSVEPEGAQGCLAPPPSAAAVGVSLISLSRWKTFCLRKKALD
jgi:hypothetical protein